MASKKVFVITGVNFLRAYGGIKYLCQNLTARGVELQICAPIPREMVKELDGWPVPMYSYYTKWYSGCRKFRSLICAARTIIQVLATDSALLVCELQFYFVAVLIKKLKPKTPVIFYSQEMLTPEEHSSGYLGKLVRYYERYSDIPDLLIDVNPYRVAKRKERFKITKEVIILPNTIPLSEIPNPGPIGTLSSLAGGGLPANIPILIYAGGAHFSMGWDFILDAVDSVSLSLFFLAFCQGTREEIMLLRQKVQKHRGARKVRVCDAVPRTTLLSCLHEANAGLVFYPYSAERSTNQLYCAPTKALEYIGVGLPVIASANPPLIDLIDGYALGVCAKDDTAASLTEAIEKLFKKSSFQLQEMRSRERLIFKEKLCFERVSEGVLDRIQTQISA